MNNQKSKDEKKKKKQDDHIKRNRDLFQKMRKKE